MFSVATIISLVIFLIVAWSGYRNGLWSTLVMLCVTTFSAMLAMSFFIPLWNIALFAKMGWHAPPILFLGTFLISLGVMQTVANYLLPPRLTLPKKVDVIGGAVLGLVTAYLMTGILMTGFALFPGTGGPESKVVMLKADMFFANTMSCASRWSGSETLDAGKFIEDAKREKYEYSAREIDERDEDRKEQLCSVRLDRLYKAVRAFVEREGRFPEKVDELAPYLPDRVKKEHVDEWLSCPLTEFAYRCAPVDVKRWDEILKNNNYILLYDAIGGTAGHQGRQAGKRVVLTGTGRTEWLEEATFTKWMRDQAKEVASAAASE